MKEKKKINGWKLTAIISLILNGLTALLLTIGLASPRSYVKANADFEYSYDTSKIITSTNRIDYNYDYYMYFDWDNLPVVDNQINTYFFPYIDNVSPFNITINGIITDLVNDRRIYRLQIFRSDLTSPVVFRVSLANGNSQAVSTEAFMTITTNGTLYFNNNLDFLIPSFKSIFNGSRTYSSYNLLVASGSLEFLYSYFSDYSVHNIELAYKGDAYNNITSIDYQASTPLYMTQTNNYYFLDGIPIIYSDSELFDNNGSSNSVPDFGFSFLYDGTISVNGTYYSGLGLMWKQFTLSDYWTIFADNRLIYEHNTPPSSFTYRYYLDSVVPILNFSEEFSFQVDKPIAYLHKDVIQTNSVLDQTGLVLTYNSDLSLTNNKVTIIRSNLYSYSIDGEALNQNPSMSWGVVSQIFKPINHFYFNSGSPVITEPSSNDIENSTNNITGVFALISSAFESLIPLLSISVLPNISLGLLMFIPLILTIIIVVIKLVKR